MDTMQDLRQQYEAAAAADDVEARVQCLWDAMTVVQEGGTDADNYFGHRLRLLFWAGLRGLERGDGQPLLALRGLAHLDQLNMFQRVQRYIGQAWLAAGQPREAATELRAYLQQYPDDEEGWYYLGNACVALHEMTEAAAAYAEALTRRPLFLAARVRAGELCAALGDASVLAAIPEAERAAWASVQAPDWLLPLRDYTLAEVRQFPVFINVRDRVDGLRRLVAWLQRAGQTSIILLDNASTYPPLLDYLTAVQQDGVQVVHLPNLGYQALWQSGILRQLQVDTPYIYTDPDVVPGPDCPRDVIALCYAVLERHPVLDKVGLALRTADITCEQQETIRQQEAHWQLHRVEPGLTYAAVDTTLALYRGQYHYSLPASVRLAPPCELRHLPWYYREDALPADEAYYRAHADNSSSLVNLLRAQQ